MPAPPMIDPGAPATAMWGTVDLVRAAQPRAVRRTLREATPRGNSPITHRESRPAIG